MPDGAGGVYIAFVLFQVFAGNVAQAVTAGSKP